MVNTSNANISNISFWFKVEWKSHPEVVQQDCKIVLCPEYSLHLVSFIRFTEFTFLINFMQITWSNLLSPQISDSSNIYSVGQVLSNHTRRSNNYAIIMKSREIHVPLLFDAIPAKVESIQICLCLSFCIQPGCHNLRLVFFKKLSLKGLCFCDKSARMLWFLG